MLLWRGGGNFDLIKRSRIDFGRRCATSGGSGKLSFRSGSLSIIARKCFPTILQYFTYPKQIYSKSRAITLFQFVKAKSTMFHVENNFMIVQKYISSENY